MKADHVIHEGKKVFYKSTGAGYKLLFLHADFVDSRMWDGVMAILEDRYSITAYDKLGYGFSERAPGPLCRRKELADVMQAIVGGPAHLVGCSNGGLQALDFALENPGKVRSLTLVNSIPSGFQPTGEPPAEILAMVRACQEGRLDDANELQTHIWFDGPSRTPESIERERLKARGLAKAMNRIFLENGTFAVADMSPLDPLDPPAINRLGEIHVPTLVVSGVLDYGENRRASRMLADGIPGARFIEMKDCAHVPPLESPKEFAAILEEFLSSGRGSRKEKPGPGVNPAPDAGDPSPRRG
jgi:pimeloyl-ACP methyl ester carboxylesterase